MIKDTQYRNLRKIVYHAYCDDCNIQLEFCGTVHMTNPPQYPYICPNCKKQYTFNTIFPWSEIVGDEVQCDDQGRKVCVNLT